MPYLAGYPIVGNLFKNPVQSGVTVWTQPGGTGTLVYPQQPEGERSALYGLGCGHFSNCLEVFECEDLLTGQQEAVICCAQCSYIQQIIRPYSAYQDYEQTPLVVA